MKVNLVARSALAFVFFYHGLVPKLLFPSEVELMLVQLHGLPIDAIVISRVGGVLEIILAGLLIFMRRSLIPVYMAAILLLVLLIDVAVVKPEILVGAFNPVTINMASLVLCWIVVVSQRK
ncbi:MAG: DoxX family protein [Proteobacteria bacterium]|nr:MAG: DoxX family protein [Pseudomonadota bacterium]